MSDFDEPTFESADAGASHTYPRQAGELKKGTHCMIKGNPCKVVEMTTSKTGKHGHAKAHIVAIDIFTGKKLEDLCPTTHNMECPFVKRTEYQLLSVDEGTGQVSLLLESGETKDDLNLPNVPIPGKPDPTAEDEKTAQDVIKAFEAGENAFVAVLAACGVEKIVDVSIKNA